MAETTNLTTTITSEEYAHLLWRIGNADRLAEAVAADWLESAGFSFNKPSDATLEALRRYDVDLYDETKRKFEEAEEKNAESVKRAYECYERIHGPIQSLHPDSPGVTLKIETGNDPDHAPPQETGGGG